MVQSSYPFHGFIDGAGAGVTVTATNGRTSETLTAITASDNSYLIDCANFTSGYADGDTVTISASGYVSGSATIDITSREDGRLISLSKTLSASSGVFDVFNWPYSIVKCTVTAGYTDQTTGAWVAESTVETAISAHISDISIKELQYFEPAIVAKGIRNLSCNSSVGLLPLDFVRITELSGETTEWIVHAKKLSTGLLARHAGISRESFVLRRKA